MDNLSDQFGPLGSMPFGNSFSWVRNILAGTHKLCANTAHATSRSRDSKPLLRSTGPRKDFRFLTLRSP
jgi:hypothetical protein